MPSLPPQGGNPVDYKAFKYDGVIDRASHRQEPMRITGGVKAVGIMEALRAIENLHKKHPEQWINITVFDKATGDILFWKGEDTLKPHYKLETKKADVVGPPPGAQPITEIGRALREAQEKKPDQLPVVVPPVSLPVEKPAEHPRFLRYGFLNRYKVMKA
jgi:hypothetical protein